MQISLHRRQKSCHVYDGFSLGVERLALQITGDRTLINGIDKSGFEALGVVGQRLIALSRGEFLECIGDSKNQGLGVEGGFFTVGFQITQVEIVSGTVRGFEKLGAVLADNDRAGCRQTAPEGGRDIGEDISIQILRRV